MEDQRLDRVEVVADQRGDMPVAPELTQQRLRVPEDEVAGVGPGQGGVAGEEGPPSGRPAATSAAVRASSAARAISAESTASPSMRRSASSATSSRAAVTCSGGASAQAPSMHRRTRPGSKLKKVAMTVAASTAPIGADAGHEVAGLDAEAQGGVGGGGLGREVHHGVEGLERPPGLAGRSGRPGTGRRSAAMAHGNRGHGRPAAGRGRCCRPGRTRETRVRAGVRLATEAV